MIKRKLDVEEILDIGATRETFTVHRFNMKKLIDIDVIPRTIKITNIADKSDYIIAEGHTEVVEMMKSFRNKLLHEIYENSTKQLIFHDDKSLIGMISRNLLKERNDMYLVELKYWKR